MLLVPSLCDHDNYSGRGAPYPNNPNPNGGVRQVNGLQATMAAVDYTVANYPSTRGLRARDQRRLAWRVGHVSGLFRGRRAT